MPKLRLILMLLLIIPVVEIYLLIKVGGLIGAGPVVLLVIFAALLGMMLMRHQGFATLMRAQSALARGELPAIALLEGAVAIFGALLLIVPGFFTDVIALFCLIPPLRRLLLRWMVRRGTGMGSGAPRRDPAARTLEGEYWKDDERR
jgi:UPF0716 protein FxsA